MDELYAKMLIADLEVAVERYTQEAGKASYTRLAQLRGDRVRAREALLRALANVSMPVTTWLVVRDVAGNVLAKQNMGTVDVRQDDFIEVSVHLDESGRPRMEVT